MKPFDYVGASKEEAYFNFKLSSSRMVVECFFGHLKSRFRILHTGLPFRIVEKNCKVTTTCCLIQNFSYQRYQREDETIFLDDSIPLYLIEDDDIEYTSPSENLVVSGEEKREIIKSFLWASKQLIS